MAGNPETKIKFSVFNKDFNSAMRDMKNESSKLRQEYQLQAEQLKLNGSETEKLQTKMNYLQQAQQLASRKTQETATQLTRAREMYGDNSREVEALSRRLLSAQTAEQRLSNELAETTDQFQEQTDVVRQTSEAISEQGDKLKNIGGAMTATVTPALTGLGAVAMKAADNFDQAQGKMQASLGLTESEAEEFAEIAENLWADAFGENIDEAAAAVTTVSQNMRDIPTDQLQAATEKAFILADTFDADIADSTKTANTLMKNFGIESGQAFDLMTVAFQKGGNFSDELLDTLNEYAPQFKAMGYDAEGFTATLIAGAESGAFSLDKLADSAKEGFLLMGEGSDDTKDALNAMGLDADKVISDINAGGQDAQSAFMAVSSAISTIEDPAKRNQAAIAAFGTPLEDLGPEFQTFFSSVNQDLEGVEGATDKAGEALYNNFGTDLQAVMNQLQLALVPLGEVLLGFVRDILPKLTAGIQSVANWFGSLSPLGQKLTVIFGMIGAALGPFLVVLGYVVGAVSNLIPIFAKIWSWLSKLGPLFNVLRTALLFLTGPVGIVIGIIVALVAAFVLLWNKSDAFRNFFINLWTQIKAALAVALPAIRDFLIMVWNGILVAIKATLAFMKSAILNTWNAIKGFTLMVFNGLKTALIAIWTAIKTAVITIVTTYVAIVKAIFNAYVTAVKFIFNALKIFFTTVWNAIKTAVVAIVTAYVNAVRALFQVFVNGIKAIFNGVKVFFSTVWNAIKNTVTSIVTALKSTAISIFNALKSSVNSIFNSVKSTITSIWNSIKSIIIRVVSEAKSRVTSTFDSMSSRISSIFSSIKSTATSIFNSVKSAITRPIESAKDTVIGIIDSIKSAFSRMKITIPKPKIPKIDVSMGSKKVGPVSVPYPKFNVNWHKTGGVMTKPFTAGNAGFGDVEEGIVPFEGPHAMKIAKLIASAQSRLSNVSTGLVNRVMDKLVEVNIASSDVVMDGQTVGRITWDTVRDEIEREEEMNSRALGE